MSARSGNGPLLPESGAREAALFFVVFALSFLAVLAALGAKSTYGAARAWTAAVEGELTVRLKGASPAQAARALDAVARMEGVESARRLSDAEIADLLAPSFGAGGVPGSLELPQLIAVEARPGADSRAIADAAEPLLAGLGVDAVADAHGEWSGEVRRALGAARMGMAMVVAVLAVTGLSVIAFATHAALLARRDVVDVLHLSGAEDGFISAIFERRFLWLGLKAGAAGAVAALAAATALILAFSRVGGPAATAAEAPSSILPQLSLDAGDLAILLAAPAVAAAAAWLAARVTVRASLRAGPAGEG